MRPVRRDGRDADEGGRAAIRRSEGDQEGAPESLCPVAGVCIFQAQQRSRHRSAQLLAA